jgi:hypothetical protein
VTNLPYVDDKIEEATKSMVNLLIQDQMKEMEKEKKDYLENLPEP